MTDVVTKHEMWIYYNDLGELHSFPFSFPRKYTFCSLNDHYKMFSRLRRDITVPHNIKIVFE